MAAISYQLLNFERQVTKDGLVPNSQLDVTGNNSLLLVISRSITRQLQHFGGKILKNRSTVHHGAASHSVGNFCFAQLATDARHWENQSGPLRSRLLLGV